MDIYTYLKKDHRLVAELMETVLVTRDSWQRAQLFAKIREELTLHAETEEATFYKAIEKAAHSENVEEKIEHAFKEHDEIREYLDKLSSLSVESREWLEQFGEFKHSVSHHVEEEEEEIFGKARKLLSKDVAEKLARDMDALKQKQKSKYQFAA